MRQVFSSIEMPGWYFGHTVTSAGFRPAPSRWGEGYIWKENELQPFRNVACMNCLSFSASVQTGLLTPRLPVKRRKARALV